MNIIWIHQINVIEKPVGIFKIIILVLIFTSILLINGINTTKYKHISQAAQEVCAIIIFGCGIIWSWFFTRMVGWPQSNQILILIGSLLILKIVASEVNLTGIYSTFAQLFFIALLIETLFAENWSYLVWYSIGGIVGFILSDMLNRANYHHLGFILWIYPIGIIAGVLGGMNILGNLWYIVPIIGLFTGIGIFALLIKLRGGLYSKMWIGKMALLLFFPISIVTLYYGTKQNIIMIPQIIPQFNLIIFGVLGLLEIVFGMVFLIKGNPQTLLTITQKNAQQVAKKVKSS
jgi:hypothetical protein